MLKSMMKLFLASEAKNPKSIEKLREFVDGFANKTIAYIVTAGNGEGWESWKKSNAFKIVNSLGAKVKIITLENYWNKEILPDLKGTDIVWFVGGYAGYLMYWMRRTKLDMRIRDILNKGVVYVGSSAGSWVASKTLDVPEWFIGEEEVGASVIPGLGLVDFDVYPHYDEKDLEQIKKLYKGKKMYLLKNGEEIIVEDNIIEIVGEERIIG
jgi:dipeptidase E